MSKSIMQRDVSSKFIFYVNFTFWVFVFSLIYTSLLGNSQGSQNTGVGLCPTLPNLWDGSADTPSNSWPSLPLHPNSLKTVDRALGTWACCLEYRWGLCLPMTIAPKLVGLLWLSHVLLVICGRVVILVNVPSPFGTTQKEIWMPKRFLIL